MHSIRVSLRALALSIASFLALGVSVSHASARSAERRVWPVALTGLTQIAPVFCETKSCGVGSTATSALYPEMLYPYPTIAANGDLYLVDYGNPSEPLRVVGTNGRIKRVVRVPGGVSSIALAKDGRIAARGDDDVIREISPSGKIRPIAGDLAGDKSGPLEDCVCGDGGPARQANLADVSSVAYDPEGRLVIADTSHYRVRRVNANGIITTIVGTGHPCGSVGVGDPCSPSGTPATKADIRGPRRVTFAPDGTLWFTLERAGENAVLAHVEKDGRLTYADHGPIEGLTITPDGSLYTLLRVTLPADAVRGRRARILRISPDNKTATPILGAVNAAGCRKIEHALSCGDGQPALQARLDSNASSFLASDSHGGLYIGTEGQEIRYLPPAGGQAIRLSLVIQKPKTQRFPRGQTITLHYLTTTSDARITLQIARKTGKRIEIINVPGTTTGALSGTVRWNTQIASKPVRAGDYALQITAKSRGRIATRQLPITITR